MIQEYTQYTDVLVLGSGPSGFCAAYTAAKLGAKVLLVEQNGDVGGISTSGLMSHWTGSCDSPLYLEMLDEVGCGLMLYTFAEDAIALRDGLKVHEVTAEQIRELIF